MRVCILIAAVTYSGLLTAAADDKACISCHQSIRSLLSQSNIHPAVAMGCGICHVDHTQASPGKRNPHYLTVATGALCATCHAEIATKEFVHEPVKKDCTLCHDPHANLRQGLREQGNALCLECHLESAKSKFETDGPVTLFNGQVTLPPRYFQNLRLLALSNDRGHPVSNHPVLRSQDAEWPEVTCVACHNPHGADKSAAFLVHESEDTYLLCQRCHK
jgi:predicted CXXCH cytochrome family protein